MNRQFLLAGAIVLTLTACATSRTRGPDALAPLDDLCDTQWLHCIDVSVRNGGIARIDDLEVKEPNHVILWKIDPLTSNYRFTDDGIAFKSDVRLPADEFRCRSVRGGRIFFCVDRNSQRGAYAYTVTVKAPGGSPIKLDPRIVNN